MEAKRKTLELLETTLEDWQMMQRTEGDEGADWAERFEQHFYHFIDALKGWYDAQETPPKTIEEAEQHPFIQQLSQKLPAPVQLNLINELEDIIDGIEHDYYD